jgi:hypothetical protein
VLHCSCSQDAFANIGGSLRTVYAYHFVEGNARHFDLQVDAVE